VEKQSKGRSSLFLFGSSEGKSARAFFSKKPYHHREKKTNTNVEVRKKERKKERRRKGY
jgi:hypothetical protein